MFYSFGQFSILRQFFKPVEFCSVGNQKLFAIQNNFVLLLVYVQLLSVPIAVKFSIKIT